MGLGDSWGTREELLHPRDSRGRFRSKWKMATGTVNRILKALADFSPRTFPSDMEAANYTHSHGQLTKRNSNRDTMVRQFMRNFSRTQAELRAGKTTPEAAKVKAAMEPSPDDLILSRVVGPEAFGLTPETLPQIEEYTGKLVADRAFSFTNLGTPVAGPPGSITMVMATPKGTPVMFPWTSSGSQSREVVMDTDMSVRITKVDPDGKGGFYVLGVVEPNDPHKPKHLGTRAPRETEADETDVVPRAAPGAPAPPPAPGQDQRGAPGPTAPAAPGPVDPNMPPPRNEPVVSEAVGGGVPAGAPSTSTPELPTPPTPGEVPVEAAPVVNFRQAVAEAELQLPSAGARRNAWNKAYKGLADGKRQPDETLRELEADIRVAKADLADRQATGRAGDPMLGDDIKDLQKLEDLVRDRYQMPKAKSTDTVEPTAPEAPGAPSETAPRKRRRGGGGDLRNVTPETRRSIREGQEARGVRKKAEPRKVAPPSQVPDTEASKGAKTEMGKAAIGLISSEVDRKKLSKKAGAKRLRDFADSGVAGQDTDLVRQVADRIDPPKLAAKKAPAKKAAVTAETPEEMEARIRRELVTPGPASVKKVAPKEKPAPLSPGDQEEARVRRELLTPTPAKKATVQKVAKKTAPTGPEDDEARVRRELAEGAVAAKKATAAPPSLADIVANQEPEEEFEPGLIPMRTTLAELREIAKEREVTIPPSLTKKIDIINFIDAVAPRPKAVRKRAVQKVTAPDTANPNADIDSATIPQLRQIARDAGIKVPGSAKRKADIQQFLRDARAGTAPAKVAKKAVVPRESQDSKAAKGAIKAVIGNLPIEAGDAIVDDLPDNVLPDIAQAGGIDVPEGSTPGQIRNLIKKDMVGARRGGRTDAPQLKENTRQADTSARTSDRIAAAPDRIEAERILDKQLEAEASLRQRTGSDRTEDGYLRMLARDMGLNVTDDTSNADLRETILATKGPKTAFKAPEIPEAPQVPATKKATKAAARTIKVEDPQLAELVDNATPAQLRDAAREAGVDLPDTMDDKDQIVTAIARAMAQKQIATQKAKRTKAEKRTTRALEPLADSGVDMEALTKELDPELLPEPNLEAVRTGLLDPRKTPAQVGRDLETSAKFRRDHAAILYGGWQSNTSENFKAMQQAKYDQEIRVADELLKLAERLKKTRRRPAKKAVPAKATAPEATAPGATVPDRPQIERSRAIGLAAKKTAPAAPQATQARADDLGSSHIGDEVLIDGQWRRIDDVDDSDPDDDGTVVVIDGDGDRHFLKSADLIQVRTSQPVAPVKKATPAKKVAPAAGKDPITVAGLPSGGPVRRGRNVTDGEGRITRRDRANADVPIQLPNGGSDQGALHLDSAIGTLWADLYADDRASNSFLNELADWGQRMSYVREGSSRASLRDILDHFKEMRKRAPDQAVADRIQDTISGLDWPNMDVPDLPDGVPAPVRKYLEELARIPTAHRTGRIGSSSRSQSVLAERAQLIRDIQEGNFDIRRIEFQLKERNVHESFDGGFDMWRLDEETFDRKNPDSPEIRKWIRDRFTAAGAKKKAASEGEGKTGPAPKVPEGTRKGKWRQDYIRPGRDQLQEIIDKAPDILMAVKMTPSNDTSYRVDRRLRAISAEQSGFTDPPQVVSRADLDEAVAGGWVELFRGVMGSLGRSAESIRENFRTGPYHPGKGLYGNGFYTSPRRHTADRYADSSGMLRMALHPDARIIKLSDLDARVRDWLRRRQDELGDKSMADDEAVDILQDPGRFAAALGFDAVLIPPDAHAGDGGKYRAGEAKAPQYLILNRSALLVQDEDEKPTFRQEFDS